MATAGEITARLNQIDDTNERFQYVQSIPGLDPGQQLRLATIARQGSEVAGEQVADVLPNGVAGFNAGVSFTPSGAGAPPPTLSRPPSSPTAVSTSGLGVANALANLPGGGAQDVAFGFPLFSQMVDLILRADAARRATVDQNVSILRLVSDLERVSPTRAASVAAGLGLPEPQFDFLDVLFQGGPAFNPTGTSFGGRVGTQDVQLPGVLGGQQLANLGSNPNVANIVSDVADYFGRPDYLAQSAASLIPTSVGALAGAL